MPRQGGSDNGEEQKVLFADSVESASYELSLVRSHLNQYAQDDVPMQRHDIYKTLTRVNKVMRILHGKE